MKKIKKNLMKKMQKKPKELVACRCEIGCPAACTVGGWGPWGQCAPRNCDGGGAVVLLMFLLLISI